MGFKGKLEHDFNDKTYLKLPHCTLWRLIIIRKGIYKNELKGPKWSIIPDKHTDILHREFRYQKGIPLPTLRVLSYKENY